MVSFPDGRLAKLALPTAIQERVLSRVVSEGIAGSGEAIESTTQLGWLLAA